MTKFLMFAAVSAVSFNLFAQTAFNVGGPLDQDLPPGAKVDYQSWCQGDSIMSENRAGEIVRLWDCSEISESSRCVENSVRKGEWTIVSATCK